MQQDGQYVQLAVGGGACFGYPFVGVEGGEEFGVVARCGVDEPAVSDGVVVESDVGVGGLAQGAIVGVDKV